MLIHGGCHCGNISFALLWSPDPVEIPARECGCSFCLKHGGVWTSKPGGSLYVSIRDPARASAYVFGTRTAEFHVCADCGVVPVVTSHIGDRLYAVVNTNTFEGVDRALLKRSPARFDDETEEQRLARRQRHWIGDVSFAKGPAR